MTLVLSPSEIISKLEKNGELGLLGKAPRWNRRLLGELTNVQNGAPFSSDKFNREGLGMPLIRIRDVGASETSTYFDGEYDPAYVVRAGDLLVGMDGDFRCAKWTSGDALLNQRVCRLKVISAELDERFLFLILQGYLDAIWKETSATTVKHLSSKSIQQIPIPLPSMKEQRKIVELLEDHLSHLDSALADINQAKIRAAQFRKSLLQSIFEGKYSPNSDNWERKAIGDFAEVKGGKRLPKGTKWSDEPTRHPYIRATDIKFGKIQIEGLVHVPDSVWKSISRYVVEENDVVITIAGTIGEIAVVPASLAGANLTENAAKLVFDHEYVLPSFLSMYLQSPSVQQEFKDLSKATTQAKLALYRIATVEIPVPTLHEQQEIMELVEEKLTYLVSSLNQIVDVELHVASLRRSLLQAAFTGQLTNEVVSV